MASVDLTVFTDVFMLAFCIAEEASISITPKWSSRFTGEALNLTAVVGGNPLPTTIRIAKWDVQAGNYRDYPKTKYVITDLRSIIILDLSLEDNGVYRACVENSHNNIQCAMFTIVVKGNDTNGLICCCDNAAYISWEISQVVACIINDLIPL